MATAEQPKARWERAVEALFRNLWQWGALYALIVMSLGWALFPLTDVEAIRYLVKNDLPAAGRSRALLAVAISVVVTTTGYLLTWLRARRREPELGWIESLRRTNRYAIILLILPMITILGVPRLETKNPVFTATLMLMITAVSLVFLYRIMARWWGPDDDPFQATARPSRPRIMLGAAVLSYIAVIGAYAVIDHRNLGTAIYDLGIYDNTAWQTAHGYFLDCTFVKGGNHISAHFDPIMGLVAVFYRLWMRAETLLILQTVWLASGAIPLYLLARNRLKNEWFGALLALVYLLHPGLHGVNMFDFHTLALIVPNVMWAVYLLDVGGFRRYWLVFVLLLLTREDISLICCFIGAYAILSGRTRTGLVTIGLSLVYLYIAKVHIMASTDLLTSSNNSSYSYAYYYAEMIPHKKEGTRGLIVSLLTNPLYAVQVVFKEEKLLFFLHILLPLLGLPFVAGRKLILSVYGLLFVGLASRKHVYSLHFQYSALLLPMLFAAIPDGLARVSESTRLRALGFERARLAWTLIFGMLVSATVVTVKYGVIFPNAAFKAGWNRLTRVSTPDMRERYARVREIVAFVGPDAAVSMTSAIGPHLSNRRKAYHWPTVQDADFIVLNSDNYRKEDERRIKRLKDKRQFRLVDDVAGIALFQRILPDDPDAKAPPKPKPTPASKRKPPATKAAEPDDGDGDTTGNLIVKPVPTAPTTSTRSGPLAAPTKAPATKAGATTTAPVQPGTTPSMAPSVPQ